MVLDADVFITAKNTYYAFDICPGFWKGIIAAHEQGAVGSIDRVKSELLAGREQEDLVQWVKNTLPGSFFGACDVEDIAAAYSEIMLWVEGSTQYLPRARSRFAATADGWLVAYSMVHGCSVVTNERSRRDSKGRICIPDVCAQFGVPCKDTFRMIRDLGMQFDLVSSL
jgi:hypothetical protein